MKDRLLRGALAGIMAELACVVINLASANLLHYAKVRWVQMLSHLIVGRPMITPLDAAVGYFLCAALGGALGFLFARFMIPEPEEGDYYFRAVSLAIGFMILAYALGNATRTPTMTNIAPETTITTLVSGIAWGLITGYLVRRWDRVYA